MVIAIATYQDIFLTRKSLFTNLFSIVKNTKSLVEDEYDETLWSINGIRTLTIIWIVMGHSIEWSEHRLFSRLVHGTEIITSIPLNMFFNCYYSVEMFFLIGSV